MPTADHNPITQLLVDWSQGQAKALDELAPLVYADLRMMAARHLRRERSPETLQPTVLVHEAFLRLFGQKDVQWQNRFHFFSLASRLMRRILVDQARARFTSKRGSGREDLSLDDLSITLEDGATSIFTPAAHEDAPLDVLSVDAALTRLEEFDPRQAQIVELRFFGGLTVEEAAEFLEVSPATIKRDWVLAKAWLTRELAGTLE